MKYDSEMAGIIKEGGIAVIPTDTIYGIVGSALNPEIVEKIYRLRSRSEHKPFIVLVSSVDEAKVFCGEIPLESQSILESIWPEKASVILPVTDPKFEYLTRGTGTLALRMPKDPELLEFLQMTGPLVAPSANPESEKPAETLDEAWEYFPELDFYIDGGTLQNIPSTLLKIEEGKIVVLRQGAWKVPDFLK